MGDRRIPVLALATVAAVVPPALLHFVGHDKVIIGGWTHFIGVALGAGVATLCAVALTVAGARQKDGHAVLVGCAFSVMAALLCLHGLATPGILFDAYGVAAFTGGATLPVGGAILALGRIAHDATLAALGMKRSALAFSHGARHELPRGVAFFDSYHCSRYNTNTGRLTRAMFRAVFRDVAAYLGRPAPTE